MSAKKTEIHYVASTHWDREWIRTFQEYRFELVRLIDGLIDLLETKPEYEHFVFDGQTIVLADYMEVRPENRPRLEKLLRDGRILIGPWYTMPDERLLSGESLIRNIMRGYRDAAGWGVEPMRYGYVCDIFGHIAQMPQIFAGMGIRYALVGRGTNEHTHPAHLTWRAPDGSQVLAFKEQDDEHYGVAHSLWEAAGGAAGAGFDRERIVEAARAIRTKEEKRSDVPVQLWLDGFDRQLPASRMAEALDIAREAIPDAEVIFSTLPDFARAVEPYSEGLPVFEGELIDVGKSEGRAIYLISHCLSSYYPLKLANDRCQTLLERWAEPYLVWAALEGRAPSPNFLDLAWQFLLQNHPHDSICGCSIDQVHKDNEYRYDQCDGIARTVLKDCHAALARAEDGEAQAVTLAVFNATPVAGKRVIAAEFDYPPQFPSRGLTGFSDDRIPCFDLLDRDGRRVDYQMHRYVAGDEYHGLPAWGAPYARIMRVKTYFESDFEGIGAKNFTIVPREKAYRDMGSQLTGALTMENEHLAVSANADGTINVTAKADGRTFENLCIFEDTGEMGDGWYHIKPVHNKTFFSTGFPTGISVIDDGSLVTTLRMEKTLMLPAEFDWGVMSRSDERKPLDLTLDVILRKGAPYVECVAKVDNTIRDHRLRVLFPTGVRGTDYFASQPFTFVKRKRGVDRSTFDWKENDTEERNFHGIAGVADAKGGLALVAGDGLHEIAVRDDSDATMAMTLMRAFKRAVVFPYTGRGQLQQQMTFAWRIVPFGGKPDFAALTNLQQEFHAGVRTRVVAGTAREAGTFVSFKSGAAMLSALKTAQDRDSVTVRVFNPTEEQVRDELTFAAAFESAVEVNHAEEPLDGAAAIKGGATLAIELPPHKIRTYRLKFAKP